MTQEKLNKIIESHQHWLKRDCEGWENMRANLSGANLYCANLSWTNLSGVNLSPVVLDRTDLNGANLDRTNFIGTDFSQAKNVPYIPMVCPEEGRFVGWKNIYGYIVKLEIPAKAKRSSAATRECRCEYAKVLGIYTIDGKKAKISEITSTDYHRTTYKVGEMVYPDSFDENRWYECSHGIHFFVNRQEAINYFNILTLNNKKIDL